VSWWVTETAPEEWWAVDTRTGLSSLLDPEVGLSLWLRGDSRRPLAGELERARNSAGAGAETKPSVDLRFAGTTARYVCEEAATRDRLARELPAALPPLRSTPDVLISLARGADLDRLHRSLPEARHGVEIRAATAEEWVAADPDLPVVPSVQGTSLARRFAVLHAALLVAEGGAGTVFAGAQKSGKTTAVRMAAAAGLGRVATDEMTLLGSGGTAVGVPLPLRVRSDAGRSAEPLAAAEAPGPGPVAVRRVVLLETAEDAFGLAPIDGREALVALARHLRPLALPLGTAARFLLELIGSGSTWRLGCRPWPELDLDLAAGLEQLEGSPA